MRAADPGVPVRALRATGRFLLRIPWPLAALLVVGWAALIWDLSSHSRPAPEHPSWWWELASNLAHAPLFGLLTLWVAALCLRRSDGAWPQKADARVLLVVGLVVAWGVLDEWHQSRVPGRDASALDVLTDAVSATVLLWVAVGLGRDDFGSRRLFGRLSLGVLACLAAATLATFA